MNGFVDSHWYDGKPSDAAEQVRKGLAYMEARYGEADGMGVTAAAMTWTPATVGLGWKAEVDIPRYAVKGDLVHVAGTFRNLCAFDHYPAPSIIGLPRPAMSGTVMFRTLAGNGVMTGQLGADGSITVLTTRLIPVFVAFQIADLAYLKASQ